MIHQPLSIMTVRRWPLVLHDHASSTAPAHQDVPEQGPVKLVVGVFGDGYLVPSYSCHDQRLMWLVVSNSCSFVFGLVDKLLFWGWAITTNQINQISGHLNKPIVFDLIMCWVMVNDGCYILSKPWSLVLINHDCEIGLTTWVAIQNWMSIRDWSSNMRIARAL